MMTCPHDLAERETAVADGYCPICLTAENAKLRKALRIIESSTEDVEIYDVARAALKDDGAASDPWADENQRIYDEAESRISGDDKGSL